MNLNTRAMMLSVSLSMGLSLSLPSCTTKDDLTVWKAAFPSPDGLYIAAADTI
jgi:hypothetical protein